MPPLTTIEAVPLPLVPVLVGVTVLLTLLLVPKLVESGLWLVVEICAGLIYAVWIIFKWTLIYSGLLIVWISFAIYTLWNMSRPLY
ncbi:hypothetical protein EV188_114151 [Actinomycetospora succinea]|uniref:Uncharacterized protein n=1 Tax=Actinomycetospora succinea TaxID=663603 RepID=A0A4R6UNK5_9PSEU|nr:hypothetical protein EV188_114151 [Actinomycetospora succinea]